MKILALDCATEHCSAALWLDGRVLERSAPPARGLSEHLLQWVAELLQEGGVALHAVDLIAFGRGPGAFTGVRLATSLAQGLALSGQLPVAPISTLRAVAAQALELAPEAQRVLVCQDARMHEVYWAEFVRQGEFVELLGAERLSAPEAVTMPSVVMSSGATGAVATGSGFGAYPQLLEHWRTRCQGVATSTLTSASMSVPTSASAPEPLDCPPRARDIARLAAIDGLAAALPPEQALPVYLRDNVASPPTTQTL